MSSRLLTWLAAALVALVLASALWMGHSLDPAQGTSRLLLAQAASAEPAASTPAGARR